MSIKKFLENFREKRKNEIPPETKTEELCPICKKRFLKLHKPCSKITFKIFTLLQIY